MASNSNSNSNSKSQSQYLIIPSPNPLEPHKTIVIEPCKQGIPCKHCFSQDNGKTFTSRYGHDIFAFIKDITTDQKITTDLSFKHLHGMYTANNLLKYKKLNPIPTQNLT